MIPAFKSLLGKIQAVASITSRISNAAWPHTNFNGKPKVCPWIGFDFCQVGVCSIRIPSVEIGLWRIWWKNFLFWTNAVILRFFAKFPKGDFVHDEPNHANGSQGNWKRIQQSLFKYWQTHSKVSSTRNSPSFEFWFFPAQMSAVWRNLENDYRVGRVMKKVKHY